MTEFKIGEIIHPDGRIMIVADLPYNKQFEDKIVQQVNSLTKQFPDLKVYRKDLTNQ